MLRLQAVWSRLAAADVGRKRAPRQRAVNQQGAGFTIGYAGRQIRLGPVVFWVGVGSVVIMAGWSLATATYFAFRDDLLRSVVARQHEQQYAYEDRIAELRARIDRATSRQLLDQEQFEQKLDDLLRRQAALESRAAALSSITEPVATGSVRPAARGLEHGSSLEPELAPAGRKAGKRADSSAKLSLVEASLDRIERRQSTALARLQERYEGKARKLRSVLADLGLTLDARSPASGGPFVPVKLSGEGNGFERALIRVNVARAQAEQLRRALVSVPVRVPVAGDVDISSTFGVRMDPFLHLAAMHTGIDFRGNAGDPVHATAAGTVIAAGWTGGYGKMVEIDHGNGLATRYGHLSKIEVDVGDKVRLGQTVGRLGSTGRSTGPHVHYETRIDGDPVDPQKFLNAGAKLNGG